MQFAFDLISDLHVDTWPEPFNWEGRATSSFCVVAGDVARDRDLLIDTLRHLGQCYQAVFYIDGNEEHVDYYDDLPNSYRDLEKRIAKIPNVVYLQNNLVVIDGVAILGTNGWWGWDFDLGISSEQCALWWEEKMQPHAPINSRTTKSIARMSNTDATYMISSVDKLQTHLDVQHIVAVTHTVPYWELVKHDISLDGTMRFNTLGNNNMMQALGADHGNKLHTWCFGHYHGSVDQIRHDIRFLNNCQGRHGTDWCRYVYHPMRIEINV
jgi:Icc-related predicted phosphoesterase